MPLLTPDALSEAITAVGEAWLSAGHTPSLAGINVGQAPYGNCDTFAREVTAHLNEQGWDTSALMNVELANFMALSEDEEGGVLDRRLLAKHWPAVKPPQGLNWQHLEILAEDADWGPGTHVWLVLDGRHYDSQTPQGTDNFLELPFFSTGIADWKLERGTRVPAVASRKRQPR